jgi:hypothetical protein
MIRTWYLAAKLRICCAIGVRPGQRLLEDLAMSIIENLQMFFAQTRPFRV